MRQPLPLHREQKLSPGISLNILETKPAVSSNLTPNTPKSSPATHFLDLLVLASKGLCTFDFATFSCTFTSPCFCVLLAGAQTCSSFHPTLPASLGEVNPEFLCSLFSRSSRRAVWLCLTILYTTASTQAYSLA